MSVAPRRGWVQSAHRFALLVGSMTMADRKLGVQLMKIDCAWYGS